MLSSSLFTSPDALVSNRSSNASFTNSPSTQGELSRPNLVAIPPPNNRPEALEHIETLLESVIDNLINDEVLEISFRTTQSRVRSREVEGQVPVRFPGSTVQGRRFGSLPPPSCRFTDAEPLPLCRSSTFHSRNLSRSVALWTCNYQTVRQLSSTNSELPLTEQKSVLPKRRSLQVSDSRGRDG